MISTTKAKVLAYFCFLFSSHQSRQTKTITKNTSKPIFKQTQWAGKFLFTIIFVTKYFQSVDITIQLWPKQQQDTLWPNSDGFFVVFILLSLAYSFAIIVIVERRIKKSQNIVKRFNEY